MPSGMETAEAYERMYGIRVSGTVPDEPTPDPVPPEPCPPAHHLLNIGILYLLRNSIGHV